MSAEGALDRAQFLTASAAVAASVAVLPLAAAADEETVRVTMVRPGFEHLCLLQYFRCMLEI